MARSTTLVVLYQLPIVTLAYLQQRQACLMAPDWQPCPPPRSHVSSCRSRLRSVIMLPVEWKPSLELRVYRLLCGFHCHTITVQYRQDLTRLFLDSSRSIYCSDWIDSGVGVTKSDYAVASKLDES